MRESILKDIHNSFSESGLNIPENLINFNSKSKRHWLKNTGIEIANTLTRMHMHVI